MPEMQATVICNFLEKKSVHNLVTDFMVFLDLFTGKNSLMNVQVQVSKKMLQTIVSYFTSSFPFFPLPFFLFFVFAFCLFFFTFSWFFNTSLPGIFTLPSSFNSMLILVLSFCHYFSREIFIKVMFNKPHGFLRHLCHFLKILCNLLSWFYKVT